MGVDGPIREHDADGLQKDLTAHLAYGLATSLVFRLPSATDLDGSERD